MKYYFFQIIICLFSIAPCWASGELLVVQSLPIKPYNDALQGFKAVCKSRPTRIVGPDLNEAEIRGKVRRNKPDLILAIGMDALEKVKTVNDVPIVYLMVLNPQDMLRDDGNITGVSMNLAPERQFSILREVLPNVKKIGIFFDPGKNGYYISRVHNAAALMGVELLTKKVYSSREAVASVEGLKGKVDALWLLPDTTVVNPATIDLLLLSSIENKIPVLTFSDKYVEKGALLSLEVDAAESGKQAGEMAVKILGGASVNSIKREDARESILTVNLIVAKKLGISINGNVIKHARVIR
jgi:putative tryptophan/tyrosine transport system substrate-binding protein